MLQTSRKCEYLSSKGTYGCTVMKLLKPHNLGSVGVLRAQTPNETRHKSDIRGWILALACRQKSLKRFQLFSSLDSGSRKGSSHVQGYLAHKKLPPARTLQ